MRTTPRLIAPILAALLSALVILPAAAQDNLPELPSLPEDATPGSPAPPPDFPPLPIVLTGTAALDGQPIPQGRLSVRVGDWETRRPVTIRNGEFTCAEECLIAGPPSFDYVGQPVTFILDEQYTADLAFPFPNLGSPERRVVALEFDSTPPTPTPTPTPRPTPTPTPAPGGLSTPGPALIGGAVAASLLALVVLFLLAARLRRRP